MLGWLQRKREEHARAKLVKALDTCGLPSFPTVVMRVIAKLRDSDASLKEIAELLTADPGLTVRLLKTVNSAAFAVRREVRTVEHAVALLGRGRLEALLLAVAVRGALPRTLGFDAQQFWTASARRATTARRLAAVLHPSTQAESFTAALLQDMAVPMLHQAHTTRYASVWAAWQNSDRSTCLTELERSTFGWDHSQVGSWMCAAWSFPEGLTEAIGGHHGTVQGLMAPPAVMLSSQIRDADGIDALDGMIAQLEGDYGIKADDAVELLEESFRDGEAIARLLTP